MRRALIVILATYAAAWPVYAAEPCGDFNNTTGPWDYRNQRQSLKLVEDNHFDANVENLKCCKNGPLGADIDFTLRAYPNHHRALISMEKFASKLGVERVPHANFSVACYYERAIRFRPDDSTARFLFANYLAKKGNTKEALKQMEYLEQNAPPSANLHYNLGLVYLDVKQYDKSLYHAHRAYELGFSLPGLRNRLQRAGKWREPATGEPIKPDTAAGRSNSQNVPGAEGANSSAAETSTVRP